MCVARPAPTTCPILSDIVSAESGPGKAAAIAFPAHAAHGLRIPRWLIVAGSMIVALLLCTAWLVFPYFVQGKKLLLNAGSGVKQEQRAKAISIGRFLTRVADGPGETEVEALFATPTYFEVSDRAGVVGKYQPNRYLVFVVTEATHTERLPEALPEATLRIDGVPHALVNREGPDFAEHHRTTVFQFSMRDAQGKAFSMQESHTLELVLNDKWDDAATTRVAGWQTPLAYPPHLLSRHTFTPALVLVLAAGLLSAVLTPCLLQLVVIYLATFTGVAASDLARAGAAPAARRKMLYVAFAFVAGFSALFTLAGAIIGYAGKEIQLAMAEASRNVGVAAGLLLIVMGIWMGIRSRAPLVCRLPFAPRVAQFGRGGIVGSAVTAAGFSLGCMTCFSGAIIATLLVYVGALGSAAVGAAVLFVFSLGVAIPFIAAALYLSRLAPVMAYFAQHAPLLGLASMLIMVAFGVVLITDNFHVVSNAIYPYLGLS